MPHKFFHGVENIGHYFRKGRFFFQEGYEPVQNKQVFPQLHGLAVAGCETVKKILPLDSRMKETGELYGALFNQVFQYTLTVFELPPEMKKRC